MKKNALATVSNRITAKLVLHFEYYSKLHLVSFRVTLRYVCVTQRKGREALDFSQSFFSFSHTKMHKHTDDDVYER